MENTPLTPETYPYPTQSFDEWFHYNEDKLRLKWAEQGTDRELDFDEEVEFEREYENYCLYVAIQCDNALLATI